MRSSIIAVRVLSVSLALSCSLAACTSDDADEQTPDAAEPVQTDAAADGGASRFDGANAPDPLRVETRDGPVLGEATVDARVFRSIPYAAPPVGELRWVSPQQPEPWSEPPSTESVFCPQLDGNGAVIGQEDCLKLDVWAPLDVPREKLPVMVWIHGGGFIAGSGYLFDALLQTRDVIVVAINYRLGPLGFLAHPSLSEEGGGVSGNYAIQDQRFALEWVRDNIAAFGGDPGNVTIFGESAGGSAVCAHLWSERSFGLFHRAIMQSGALCGRESRGLGQGEAQGEQLADVVGCNVVADPAACLREVEPLALLDALNPRTVISVGAVWGPLVDGFEFTQPLELVLLAGAITRVPTIIGANANEGIGFLPGLEGMTEEEYAQRVQDSPFFGEFADLVLEMYPASAYPSPHAAYGALIGHRVFDCPARRTARSLAKARANVYMYWFNQGPALHASELGYLFGLGTTESDILVAETMKDMWAQFARTGDPNGGQEPEWPRFEVESDQRYVLSDPLGVESMLLQDECDLWDQLPP